MKRFFRLYFWWICLSVAAIEPVWNGIIAGIIMISLFRWHWRNMFPKEAI